MGKTVIPEGYRSLLSLYETQKAISLLKRLFEAVSYTHLTLPTIRLV